MKKLLTYKILLVSFFCLFFLAKISSSQFYTGSYQEFGKNRVQHINFFWQHHDYEDFRVFFYGGEKTNAQYVARAVEKHLSELETSFDTKLEESIDILVFNKFSDFKQSNIGLTNEITSNVGGKTLIVGNKLFVYYEKDHPTFDINIRKGIAELLVNKLLYGGDWKKVLRTSATLKLPNWFTQGLFSYSGVNWDNNIDNIVKDGILSGKYDRLDLLEGEDAIYAGHSVWNYIKQVYGEDVIPNIIYMVNISRNYESGFRFVLGKTTRTLTNEWLTYYKTRYQKEELDKKLPVQEKIKLRRKKSKGEIFQYKVHPYGTKIAYVTNDLGKYKIWIYDITEKKYTKVLRRGFKVNRETDVTQPVITWSPNGDDLAYTEEHEGVVQLNIYNVDTKEKITRTLMGLSKVIDLSYDDAGNKMIFSAVKKGQTDLFYYNMVGNSYKQLTDDIYDDLNPQFIENSSSVIFSSNRKNDSLVENIEVKPFNYDYDLYIFNLNDNRQKTLKRVTNTPLINEFQPYEIETLKYTYLGDENGITNRYIASYDSIISSVDTAIHYRYFSKSSIVTNYKRNILKLDIIKKSAKIGVLMLHNDSYNLYLGNSNMDKLLSSGDVSDTYYQNILNSVNDSAKKTNTNIEIISIIKDNPNKKQVNINNYLFDSPQIKKEIDNPKKIVFNIDTTRQEFKLPNQKIYKINFSIDNLTSQLDRSFLNNSYQLFNPISPSFNNPNLNMFTLVEAKDLMEDYRIIGGVNLSFNLIDNNYLISFEDLKTRIDKKYMFIRQSYTSTDGIFPIKTRTHEAKYRLKYPFNEVSAIATTINFRNDNSVIASVDRRSLESENIDNNSAGLKFEYIFDNTFNKGLNLYNGTRLKVFTEYMQQIDAKKSDFFVVGTDIRHYEKIHKDLIFAGRLAASTSFGNKKLIYYLGGVDNWFLPQFNNNAVIPTDKGFAFQTIATPMRGFIQNTRYGNSFAILNSEIRWPIFKYFSKYPIQNTFFDNFQIVGFGDVGAAWTGNNPYSGNNSFNKTIITQKPLVIEIENQREPIVFGYGFGLRSQLFGYFVKFDWAWGVEDGVTQPAIRYLSIALDF